MGGYGPKATTASVMENRTEDKDPEKAAGAYSGRLGRSMLLGAHILPDFSGNGIEFTERLQSSIYMDAAGDGLKNRTAWAAEGTGVLFFDPDNLGRIEEDRQYIFTEWDPTAKSDMEALASVFDTDGQERLAMAA